MAENVPTEGFVLNRNVGGARSGYHEWDTRLEKVRVYDPRGFEFEITVPNLLFILQECTSVKGKGLDGEFIYAWAGKELVLIPTSCAEYKTSIEFTSLQNQKVSKKDMVVGCSYMTKDLEPLIYLGKFYYNFICSYSNTMVDRLMQFVFYNTKDNEFVPHKGFQKIATKTSDTPVDNYADLVEKFTKGAHGATVIGITSKPAVPSIKLDEDGNIDNGINLDEDDDAYYGRMLFSKKISENVFVSKYIYEDYNYRRKNEEGAAYVKKYYFQSNDTYKFADGKLTKNYNYNYKSNPERYTIEELKLIDDLCKLYVVLDSGQEIEIHKFLKQLKNK